MKKYVIILFSLISTSLFAEASKEQPSLMHAQEKLPTLKFAIYDVSNQVAKEQQSRKISLSNKQLQLCWVVNNVPSQLSNKMVETFIAPAKTHFTSQEGTVVSSADGKVHTVTIHLPRQPNDVFHNCWRLDETDPLGVYSHQVTVNGISFPAQSYEVVK